MDHLIDQFDCYLEWSKREFIEEWNSGKYKKYSECPSYKELKALIDSVNILRVYYGWTRLTIKQLVAFCSE